MDREALWRELAESAAAVREAIEASRQAPTLQTHAAADAACQAYVQRLGPVIGAVLAFQDAIDRLEATIATLAGGPAMDEADRVILTGLTDDMTTAQRVVDAVETELAGALDRARAHDEKGGA